MQQQPHKICPQCQQRLALHMARCGRCGAPQGVSMPAPVPNYGQPANAFAPPPAVRRPRLFHLLAGGFVLAVLFGGAARLLYTRIATHPLVGTWRKDSLYGTHRVLIFRADGMMTSTFDAEAVTRITYARPDLPGFMRTTTDSTFTEPAVHREEVMKWESKDGASPLPDTTGGVLMAGSGFDYRPSVWVMSKDGQHLRIIEQNTNSEDYERQ